MAYVYLGDQSSQNLSLQAEKNSSRTLLKAGKISLGQYVGLKKDHPEKNDFTVVVGDHLEEVVKYIKNEEVNTISDMV